MDVHALAQVAVGHGVGAYVVARDVGLYGFFVDAHVHAVDAHSPAKAVDDHPHDVDG